jgi:metal-responsive CopG/Arc/MetJ family transcriptional regulator
VTKQISIKLDDGLYKILEKRAKKNYLEMDELIEDIVRRSMLSYKKGSSESDKIDDSLVSIFSKSKKGRKPKKK